MESGEFIPAGEFMPDRAEEPGSSPGAPEIQAGHGTWGALIVPVAFAVAAWVVDQYTRSALGAWRYVPVVVLGAGAVAFAVIVVVTGVALYVDKPGSRRPPRWLTGKADRVIVALLVVAATVGAVRAIRDHSVFDAVSLVVIIVWSFFVLRSPLPSRAPDKWKRVGYQLGWILPATWFLAVDLFHLH